MDLRRNSGHFRADMAVYGGDFNNNNANGHHLASEQVRYKRGKRRKSITVTRKDDMPAIRPKTPATDSPRTRPMMLTKRSDSNISRVSVASEFATINEDAVCNDFRVDDIRQSYPLSPARRYVSFSAPIRRGSSGSSSDKPLGRRVSVISLQRSDSTVSSLMDFNGRRLSTVSDAVVVSKNRKSTPGRRGSADGHGRAHRMARRSSADAHSLLTGRRSFPPKAPSGRFHRPTGPAYQSYPPSHMDDVFYDDDDKKSAHGSREPSMAEKDDLSYEATLRRASLASIHEMHHAVTLLKNQKALAKLQKVGRSNSSPCMDASRGNSGQKRSSLRPSTPRQPLGPASVSATSLDSHLRRLSLSCSIQDMHRQVARIREKQLVKRLNSKVQFSVVEDADARSSDRRRGSTASANRRGSVGGSSVSALSVSSMSESRRSRNSEDSDSYSSSGSDYSSSSSDYSGSSSSDYSETDPSSDSEDATSSSDSDDEASSYSDNSRSSTGSRRSTDEENDAVDGGGRHSDEASSGSSTETDSGNGTLSSSHGSKTDGRPKNLQDVPGPSGIRNQASIKIRQDQETVANRGNFIDEEEQTEATPVSGPVGMYVRDGDGGSNQQVVRKGQTQSRACVIL